MSQANSARKSLPGSHRPVSPSAHSVTRTETALALAYEPNPTANNREAKRFHSDWLPNLAAGVDGSVAVGCVALWQAALMCSCSPSPTDALSRSLIAGIQAGCRSLYHQLIEPYERLVFWIALFLLEDSELAEDVANVVFMEAFHCLSDCPDDMDFGHWLTCLCVCVADDCSRNGESSSPQQSVSTHYSKASAPEACKLGRLDRKDVHDYAGSSSENGRKWKAHRTQR